MSHNKANVRKPAPPWSIELRAASLQVRYWKLRLSDLRRGTNSNATLREVADGLEWVSIPLPKLSTCQHNLRRAQRKLKGIRKHATQKRVEYLDDLITNADLRGDDKTSTQYKKLKRAEAMRDCFRKLQYILKPSSNTGVSSVEIVCKDADGNILYHPAAPDRTPKPKTELIVSRDTLEPVILARNQAHFSQATGTPFSHPPLDAVRWAGNTDMGKSMLDGTIDIESLNLTRAERIFVEELRSKVPSDPVNPLPSASITYDEWVNLFHKWRETTSTSPSGAHLGIYKAILAHMDNHSKDETPDPMPKRIIESLVALMNGTLKHGFALDRWNKVVLSLIHI